MDDDSKLFMNNLDNATLDQFNDLDSAIHPEVIKVVGIGGAGGNALNTIINSGIAEVDFIAANTDVAALRLSEAPARIILGAQKTRGRGAGANPEIGFEAAQESEELITRQLEGADMVFITCGMGGGTGTGAAPFIAEIAKEKIGALVVAIVTFPFSWEGDARRDRAMNGIAKLREKVDALVVVQNDRIVELAEKNTTSIEAFKMSDEVLRQAVAGVTGVVRKVLTVNVDFADLRSTLNNSGTAIMGIGEAKGDGRVMAAVRAAMNNPLMTSPMTGAKAVLYCLESGQDPSVHEMNEALKLIRATADKNANIFWGQGIDPDLGDTVRFTLIATGFKDTMGASPSAAAGDAAGVFEQQNLTPGDVVSEGPSSIFAGLGSNGTDIPSTFRRRKK